MRNTKELVASVRYHIMEHGSNVITDDFILDRLNIIQDMMYSYLVGSSDHFLKYIDIEIEDHQHLSKLPPVIFNHRVHSVYWYYSVTDSWIPLRRENQTKILEKLPSSLNLPQYPYLWGQLAEDCVMISPTTESFMLRVYYVPKLLPMGNLAGLITSVSADKVKLDGISNDLALGAKGTWNIMSVSGYDGTYKGAWCYDAVGTELTLMEPAFTQHRGTPIYPFVKYYDELMAPSESSKEILLRMDTVKGLKVGDYLEFGGVRGGVYISEYQLFAERSEMEEYLEGTNDKVSPDVSISEVTPTIYEVVSIDGNTVKLRCYGEVPPTLFTNGYYGVEPTDNKEFTRCIVNGETTVTIPDTLALTGLHYLQLSDTEGKLEPATFRALAVTNSNDMKVLGILPGPYTDPTAHPESLDPANPTGYMYNRANILAADGTVLFSGKFLSYTNTDYTGYSVFLADAMGEPISHGYGSTDTVIRLRIEDHMSVSNTQAPVKYIPAEVQNEIEIQLKYPISPVMNMVKPVNTGNGPLPKLYQIAEGFPELGDFPFFRHTFEVERVFNFQEKNFLYKPVEIGDYISYGITTATSIVGDAYENTLVTLVVSSIREGLHESIEQMQAILGEMLKLTKADGSHGREQVYELTRSQPRTGRHYRNQR